MKKIYDYKIGGILTIIFSIYVLLMVGFLIFSIENRVTHVAKKNANSQVKSVLDFYHINIFSTTDRNVEVAKFLALTMGVLDDSKGSPPCRVKANDILESVLEENPQILGTSICFEPNKFDGNDYLYIEALYHDETGHFISYMTWNQQNGIPAQLLTGYKTEDYYYVPREINAPYETNAYTFRIDYGSFQG